MAVQFSGTGQYLTAASAPVTAGPFSFGVWVKVDDITATRALMALSNGSTAEQIVLQVAANAGAGLARRISVRAAPRGR